MASTSSHPPSNRPLKEWDCDDTLAFLRFLRMPEDVRERFETNAVDGEMLAEILGRPREEGDADLMNELGMLKLQIGKLRRDLGKLESSELSW